MADGFQIVFVLPLLNNGVAGMLGQNYCWWRWKWSEPPTWDCISITHLGWSYPMCQGFEAFFWIMQRSSHCRSGTPYGDCNRPRFIIRPIDNVDIWHLGPSLLGHQMSPVPSRISKQSCSLLRDACVRGFLRAKLLAQFNPKILRQQLRIWSTTIWVRNHLQSTLSTPGSKPKLNPSVSLLRKAPLLCAARHAWEWRSSALIPSYPCRNGIFGRRSWRMVRLNNWWVQLCMVNDGIHLVFSLICVSQRSLDHSW